MTLLALTLATTLHAPLAEPEPPAWLNLGEATVNDSSWSVSIGAPRRALADSTRVANGSWVILHLPWVRSVKRQLRYATSPVETLRVKPVPRGTVLMFRPRDNDPAALLELMEIDRGDPSTVRFGTMDGTTVASAVAALPATLEFSASETLAEPLFPRPAPQAKPHPMIASSTPSHVDVRLGAAFLLLVSVAAAVVWYRKRRQRVEGVDPTIDVVAVRSIGGKYRLVLVDACGERLLLAATDKDVQMLRSVPASSNTVEFAEALRQRSDGLGDVEGLLRLREDRRRATTDAEGVAA